MKYAVVWMPRAKQVLAKSWVESPNRNAITKAADALDSLLAAAPYEVGESREEIHLRFTVEGPLKIFFQIFEREKRVVVVHVSV